MTTEVRIPEGKSWLDTITAAEVWIKERWPDIIDAKVGTPDDADYFETYPGLTDIAIVFKDPDKAMIFKLSWMDEV